MENSDPVDRIVRQWADERPDLDATPLLVAARLQRVAALMDAALRPPFAAIGLRNGDFDVLAALRRAGSPYSLRPVELHRELLVTTGAISKRIDRLVDQGYVDRSASDDDGRGTMVTLTDEGLELVDRMIEVHLTNEREILGDFDAAELATLAGLLRRLSVSLDP